MASPRSPVRPGSTTVEGALDAATALTWTLATDLSPSVLQTDRLADVLRWLAERARETYGLDAEVAGDADVPDPALRVLLYHLARKLLFNVAKHSGVGRARVVVDDADGHVAVTVEDGRAGRGRGRRRASPAPRPRGDSLAAPLDPLRRGARVRRAARTATSLYSRVMAAGSGRRERAPAW